MILGHINTQPPFQFPVIIQKCLDFLHNLDLQDLSSGTIEIDGDKVFAEVVDTITHFKEETRPESHQKYVDIHYLISGKEYIGTVIDTEDNPIYKAFVPGKDIQFYEHVKHETFIELFPGSYVILFPQDIHRPCCCLTEPVSIRKIIVKIAVGEL